MNTLRCCICDKTNNKDLFSNYSNTNGSYRRFVSDHSTTGYLCSECSTEIQDTLYEYHIDVPSPENEPGGLYEFVTEELEE